MKRWAGGKCACTRSVVTLEGTEGWEGELRNGCGIETRHDCAMLGLAKDKAR